MNEIIQRPEIPTVGTIISDELTPWDPNERRTVVVTGVSDTAKALTVYMTLTITNTDKDGNEQKTVLKETSVRQKYRALGGPLDGLYVTQEYAPDYVLFNRSIRPERYPSVVLPKAVLMWTGYFPSAE